MPGTPANSYTGQISQHNWISGLDLVKPVYDTVLIDAYGNDPFYKELMFWKMQGTRKIVNNSGGWSWFDEQPFNQQVIVKANAGTATTTLSFTLDTTLINTLDGQRSIYPAVGDYLKDMRTQNVGRITSITDDGTDFTIVATSVTGTNWVAPAVGREYALFTYAEFEDAQTLGAAKDSYVIKKSATLQRFAKKCKTTSDVLTDALWVETDEAGNYIGTWGDKQLIDTERRLALDQVGAMWLGVTTTASGNPSTTNGAWAAFAAQATNLTYTAGTPTLAQVSQVTKTLKANGAYGSQMWMLPYKTYEDIQTVFRAANAASDLNINQIKAREARTIFEDSVESATEGLARVFDVNTVILNGVVINQRLLNISFDPRVFGCDGVTNNKFLTAGFVAPTARMKDGEGKKVGLIEVGYKSMGKYDLMQTYGEIGWLASGGANSEENALTKGMRSHLGYGFRGLTQCVYLQAA